MKKSIIAMSVLALFTTGVMAATATKAVPAVKDVHAHKIGFVDFSAVFNQVPQGKAKLTTLRAAIKPQIAKLKEEQTELVGQIKTLERNAATMTKEEKASKEKTITGQQAAFEKKVQTLQAAEMKKEQAAAKVFATELQASVKDIAKAEHYDVIFTSQAAPYFDAKYNVTSQIVAKMKTVD